MASVNLFQRRFTPSWVVGFVTIFVFILFVDLGFWQIKRAHVKEAMLAQYDRQAAEKPVAWMPNKPLPKQYQPITVKGYFLPQVMLLDNQMRDNRFGYHVIVPFVFSKQLGDSFATVLLVDQGWIAGDSTRRSWPTPEFLTGEVTLTGMAYYPGRNPLLLGAAIDKHKDNITVIETLEPRILSQFLHKSTYPFIIRQNQPSMARHVQSWKIVSISPKRHYAYAFQWFALAGLAIVGFFVLSFEKKDE